MKNATDIVVLLDRSGSMESIRADTIGGLNRFLKDQQALPGEARFTLYQFDSVGFDKTVDYQPVRDVRPLTEADFQPRAMTPLLDAMARTIMETGQRLEATPEPERPDRVVMVIVTDGQENVSREFTKAQVLEKVKHQTDIYGWMFLYLGANQDGIAVGQGLGINTQHAATYAATAKGVHASYQAVSNMVRQRRSGVSAAYIGYSAEDREEMAKR
jgi:hypothetical protein